MTAQSLLSDLTVAGVILSADGGRLDVDAPDDLLTDDLLTTLRERKAELLELLADDGGSALPLTTDRIRAMRQKYHPAPDQAGENIEMQDSALFDVVVEVGFYDGRRIRIPQQSTPSGWTAPF